MNNLRHVVPLEKLDAASTDRAGSKATVLGCLLRDGFTIPDGFVFTTAGPQADGLTTDELTTDEAAQIIAAAHTLGADSFAVRSSGISEDRADRSFAGLYESILNVRGDDDLIEAVKSVLASAHTETVAHYAGDGRSAGMAVLIQRMLPAEAAGVAFSANPATGDRGQVVINAVKETSESLTSGEVSPDEWLVSGSDAVQRVGRWNAIDHAQAKAIADLARRVEQHRGAPQDIEWAFADGRLWLLQARPITALPPPAVPIPIKAPRGYWERHDYMPAPLFPIDREYPSMLTVATEHMCTEFGLLFKTMDCQEIGGWCYRRVVPLDGKDRKAPPGWVLWLLARVVPNLRARIRQCVRAVREDRSGWAIERWYDVWQPQFEQRIQAMQAVNLSAVTDAELAQHIVAARRLLVDGLEVHFMLVGAQSIPLWEMASACQELFGWDSAKSYELLAGLSSASTEPSRRLAELAAAASRSPVRALLESTHQPTMDELAHADAGFAAAFEEYQSLYGGRSLRFEIAGPTVAEQPAITLRLIKGILSGGYAPDADRQALADRRNEVGAAARSALNTRPDQLARFERLLARAERVYATRDTNAILTANIPTALARYAVLEAGRRLAAAGRIAAAEEVFFLELKEVHAALANLGQTVPGGHYGHKVDVRKGQRRWATANPGPHSYGRNPGPPPPFEAFPVEVRQSMQAALWALEQVLAAETSLPDDGSGLLRGLGASPGSYRGPARILLNEDEFDKLRPGDVLVCPNTSPVWSVLFSSVGALVTDSGGLLSHPAIIAREYRIPAVVATGDATRVLTDGQMVVVDGDAGTVEVAP